MQISLYDTKKADISDGMFGLFFEDINYAADGGLYAEMIENRNFEFYKSTMGGMSDFYTEKDGLYGWKPFKKGKLRLVSGSPVALENPHYLRFTGTEAGQGFTNKAYDGITLKKGMKYNVSFWARNVGGIKNVKVSVLEKKSETIAGEVTIPLTVSKEGTLREWIKYKGTLTAKDDIRGGIFTVTTSDAGTVEFDFISMIPGDAVKGIFRKDLFDKLKKINPGFLRFPGGCIVEGSTLASRYNFKDTLHPLEHRKSNWSRWAVHSSWIKEPHPGPDFYEHYNQTYGIGFYEFFLLCELLDCKPLPVLNVGLACQYQSFELAKIGTPEFDSYLQDALDLIAFANEPVTGKWGKIRAELGHPEPFNLEMVGIGNEQWDTPHTKFFERYKIFEKTIHEKYPKIKLIGSAGPNVITDDFGKSWKFIKKGFAQNKNFVYAVDEHYYMPPQWFLDNVKFYDKYDRNIKVFAGEYAAHPKGSGKFNTPTANTLEGAVCEAAFLTGVERNADAVVLASYAPMFARLGYSQWSPDMIWFDDETSYGTPSYDVQVMYSNYTGNATLDTKGEQEKLYKEGIYYNPSVDKESGKIFLKIVNTNDKAVEIDLSNKTKSAYKISEIISLGGQKKTASNSIKNPDLVSMKKTKGGKVIDANGAQKITLEKNTFAVVILEK